MQAQAQLSLSQVSHKLSLIKNIRQNLSLSHTHSLTKGVATHAFFAERELTMSGKRGSWR